MWNADLMPEKLFGSINCMSEKGHQQFNGNTWWWRTTGTASSSCEVLYQPFHLPWRACWLQPSCWCFGVWWAHPERCCPDPLPSPSSPWSPESQGLCLLQHHVHTCIQQLKSGSLSPATPCTHMHTTAEIRVLVSCNTTYTHAYNSWSQGPCCQQHHVGTNSWNQGPNKWSQGPCRLQHHIHTCIQQLKSGSLSLATHHIHTCIQLKSGSLSPATPCTHMHTTAEVRVLVACNNMYTHAYNSWNQGPCLLQHTTYTPAYSWSPGPCRLQHHVHTCIQQLKSGSLLTATPHLHTHTAAEAWVLVSCNPTHRNTNSWSHGPCHPQHRTRICIQTAEVRVLVNRLKQVDKCNKQNGWPTTYHTWGTHIFFKQIKNRTINTNGKRMTTKQRESGLNQPITQCKLHNRCKKQEW